MKGFAMLGIGQTGWIEKENPVCGPLDAIVRPIAVAPCTSDIHTVWAGAIGERHDMVLGHEAVGEIVEVGAAVNNTHCALLREGNIDLQAQPVVELETYAQLIV